MKTYKALFLILTIFTSLTLLTSCTPPLDAAAWKEREQQRIQKQQELAVLKQNAPRGYLIECTLQYAEINNYRQWLPIQPLAFALYKGYQEEIIPNPATSASYASSIWVYFDGMQMDMCPAQRYNSPGDCVTVAGTRQDFENQVTRRVRSNFISGVITCSFPLHDEPHRVIIRQ